jgi:hypothetical protein
VPLS